MAANLLRQRGAGQRADAGRRGDPAAGGDDVACRTAGPLRDFPWGTRPGALSRCPADPATRPCDGWGAGRVAAANRGEAEMDVVDRLRDVRVLDLDGGKLRLGDLWAERTVALVFLRHYG